MLAKALLSSSCCCQSLLTLPCASCLAHLSRDVGATVHAVNHVTPMSELSSCYLPPYGGNMHWIANRNHINAM